MFRTTIKDIDSLYHATNNQTLESIFKNIISKFKPILSDDNISDTSILASSSHFLTYDILNYYDIATLRFGTNITSVYSKYKKLPLPQDELQQYLDLSKIDNFMKTILVNIFYLSGRDPNLGLSKTKNPCISYFE